MTGFAAPSAADQTSGPYIGMWTSGSAGQAAQLDQLGVGWARAVAIWASIETADNIYTWGELDGQVNAAATGGRRVLVMVRNNPTWAAASRCKVTTDTERSRLADFLTAAVTRYKDRVQYWQLYNEMDNTSEAFDQQHDLGGCFGTASGSTPTQAGRDNYARMLEVVGNTIHAADPTAKVVSGAVVSSNFVGSTVQGSNCTDCIFDADFIKGVLASLKANNTLDRLDIVAVHFFSSQSAFFNPLGLGPDLIGRVNKLRQDMRQIPLSDDQLKPIMMDEGSFTSIAVALSTGDPSSVFNQAQRNYIVKALTRAAFVDLTAYYWFALQDASTGLGSDNAYGLLARDGDKKPSFFALQYFQSQVTRQEQFVGPVDTGHAKLEGYEFTANDGKRFQIVWNETDTSSVGYSPAGNILAVTDSLGGTVPFANNVISVGSEPRYIVYSPVPATVTPTPTATALPTQTPGPTPTPGGPVTCTPRPPVTVAAAPSESGSLQVTVTVVGLNNRALALQFGAVTNGVIDVGSQTGLAGNTTVTLPAGTTQTAFMVRRVASGAVTVPLTIVDGCGSWPTFVGGGPSAF